MDIKELRKLKNKSGKLIRALNFYESMEGEIYEEFYNCERCNGTLEEHIKNCK